MTTITIEKAAAMLAQQDHILVLMHKSPDGDAIGCAYGLCKALRKMGKQAQPLCSDPISARYDYLTSGFEVQHFDACGLPVQWHAVVWNLVFFTHCVQFLVFLVLGIYQFACLLESSASEADCHILVKMLLADMGDNRQKLPLLVPVATDVCVLARD